MLGIGINVLFNALLLSTLLFLCKKRGRVYVLLFIIIFTLNQIALRVGRIYFDFNLSRNWEGKALSVLVSIVFILISKKYMKTVSNEDYKISLEHKKYKKRAVFLCIAALMFIAISSYFIFNNKQTFSIEELLFQASMPGIDEELCFRGVYLALLNVAFTKRTKFLGAEFGQGLIITSILFGLGHSLYISSSIGFTFNFFIFVYTGIIGFILGLLAEATQSLILPIVSHNTFNIVVTLVSMLR